jgi:hypothetical protein
MESKRARAIDRQNVDAAIAAINKGMGGPVRRRLRQ